MNLFHCSKFLNAKSLQHVPGLSHMSEFSLLYTPVQFRLARFLDWMTLKARETSQRCHLSHVGSLIFRFFHVFYKNLSVKSMQKLVALYGLRHPPIEFN